MVILVKFHPFQSILVHWFLKCQCSLLPSPAWTLPIFLKSWTEHSRIPCSIVLYSIGLDFHHQTHRQRSIISTLAQALHLSEFITNCPLLLFPSGILDTFRPGGLVSWHHVREIPFPSVLSNSPSGQSILGGRAFPLRTLNLPGHSLLTCSVSGEESAAALWGFSLMKPLDTWTLPLDLSHFWHFHDPVLVRVGWDPVLCGGAGRRPSGLCSQRHQCRPS